MYTRLIASFDHKTMIHAQIFHTRPLFPLITMMIAAAFLIASTAAQAKSFTPAKLVNEYGTTYPKRDALSDTAEQSTDSGLVDVILMVDKSGKVVHPQVVRSTDPRFEEEAIKAVKRYEYQPAMLDGKPVESVKYEELRFIFKITDSRDSRGGRASFNDTRRNGLPDGFRTFHDRFSAKIEESSATQAELAELLERMIEIKHQSFYSLAYYQLARYKFATRFEDDKMRIDALERLIWIDQRIRKKHQILNEDLGPSVKTSLISAQLEAGRFADALRNYEVFSAEDSKLKSDLAPYIDQLKALRDSDKIVQREFSLGDNGIAITPLLKRSFIVELVEGNIETLTLRCDTAFEQVTYKFDTRIKLPESWGECFLQIDGKPGSAITFLQQ